MTARVAVTLALVALVLAGAGPGDAQGPGAERAQLVYSHDGRIYTLAADGSGRRLLAAPDDRPAYHDYREPAPSPDGSALAFVDLLDGGDGGSRLMITDASGTRPLARGAPILSPAWSPDGRWIAYTSFRGTGRELRTTIVVAARDGSESRVLVRQRLDRRLSQVSQPRWLPDGRTLAYTRVRLDRRSYFRPAIFTVPAQGGAPRLLLRDAQSPDWSADGAWLVFASVRDRIKGKCGSDECSYAAELYVDRRGDAAPPRRLTRNRGDDASPRWSGDGSRILFSSDRNGPDSGSNHEVYSVRPDGGCLTWLTNGSPASFEPAWQPRAGNPAPARCGEAGRGPLAEVSPTPARGAFWLGRARYGDLSLSEVQPGRRVTFVDYNDCVRFLARDCPGSVLISTSSVCDAYVQPTTMLEAAGARLRRLRGTVLVDLRPEGEVELLSGTSAARVEIEGRRTAARYREVLDDLVRIGSRDRAGARLPLVRLPAPQARALRRALALRPRYPTLRAAARALSVTSGRLRAQLRLGRTLRASGGIRAASCG